MKLPICRIDAQTGTLCRKCKQLYREGRITDLDIDISKELVQLERNHKELKSVAVYSVIDLDDVVIIVTNKDDVEILSKEPIYNQIVNVTHKPIKFLEKTRDPKRLVENLIFPVPVENVTTVYIPPFSDKEYKIEIKSEYKSELPIPEEIMLQTIAHVLNTDAYVEYV
ncbi:MAG: hypothetical protein ACTSYD_09205 [Candidatus Heimdallarchaeaceae archaeon]